MKTVDRMFVSSRKNRTKAVVLNTVYRVARFAALAAILLPLTAFAHRGETPAPLPAIEVTKQALDDTHKYLIGELIQYEITVTNTGTVDLTNVVVTDANSDDPNVGSVATLAPGASVSFPAAHEVTQDDVDAGKVDNIAEATAEDPDGNAVTAQSQVVTVQTSVGPRMSVTKKVDDRTKDYGVGSVIRYTIVVTNTGDRELTNITVGDPNADDPNVGSIASLAPGASATFAAEHTVDDDDADIGRVVNYAVAMGKDPEGNNVVEVSVDPDCPKCQSTDVPVHPGNSKGLTLTKEADRSVEYAKAGDVIEYEIWVTNNSSVPLTDVTLVDNNADGDKKVSYTEILPGRRQLFLVAHTLTQAEVNEGVVYNIGLATAKLPDGTMVRARSIDLDPCTDCPVDPGCPDCTIVPIKQDVEIAMIKDAVNPKETYAPGEIIEYTITVENKGNVTVYDLEITDDNADDTDLGTIPILEPGQPVTFTAFHTVTQEEIDEGHVLNIAKAKNGRTPNGTEVTGESESSTPPQGDPIDPNCPTCTVVLIKQDPKISMIKDADDPDRAYAIDEVIPYTITVENTGNVTLYDITVTDDNADDPILGTIKILEPGDPPVTFTAEHTVTRDDLDRGYVLNIALATGKYGKGDPVTAESESSVPPQGDPIDPSCPKCTVVEFFAVRAVDDIFEVTWSDEQSSSTANVLANDRLKRKPVDPVDVILTPLDPPNMGIWMSPDGRITVAPYTPLGRYEYPYRICEVADPSICSVAVAVIHIIPDKSVKVTISNVFTPNGDGINDTFEVVGYENFYQVDVVIINRWGSEVYRNTNYKNDWNGRPLNNGTYYYIVTLHNGTETEVLKGAVLLKR